MTPYEIMLSESQERMLLVVKKGREAEVEAIFEKWDLHAAHIGDVTNDGILRVKDHGEVVAEIPNSPLVDEAPVYDRPTARPAYLDAANQLDEATLARLAAASTPRWRGMRSSRFSARRRSRASAGCTASTTTWCAPTRSCSPGWAPASSASRAPTRALAMSTDGNGRYCYLNPRRGAMLALAEAARNVACAGALPIGATNCLNFGNPERPEIMWQLVEAIEGLAEACRALDIPITGGNVSLYNETDGQAIYPTPIIGVVGLIEDATRVVSRTFKQAGDAVVLLGESYGELGGSEYLKTVHGLVRGQPPALSLDKERALIALLTRAAAAGLLQSAHDCSDGGLAVTLAECAFDTGGIGCDSRYPALDQRRVDALRRVGVAHRRVGGCREPAGAAAVGRRARRAGPVDRAHRR